MLYEVITQCADVSRQVGLMLDVEDIVPGAYDLEVSSPGLERRFFSTEQLRDYLGRTITAQAWEATEGRRRYTGVLTACFDDSFTLDEDGRITSYNVCYTKLLRQRDRPFLHIARDAKEDDRHGRRDRHQDGRRDAQDHPGRNQEVDQSRNRGGHTPVLV